MNVDATPQGPTSGAGFNGPVKQRIESIDIIRAIAVMAILFVNIGSYYANQSHQPPAIVSPLDVWSDRVVGLLVLDKFHFIFAFLFGVSAAILYENMSLRGKVWRPYLRRMAVLVAFGAVNLILLHAPDVLIFYAVNGTLLALFFRTPQWVLLIIGLVVACGGNLASVLVAVINHHAATGIEMVPVLSAWVVAQSLGHTFLGCWAFRAGLLTDERRIPAVRVLFAVAAVGTVALWAWALSLSNTSLINAINGNLAIVPAVAYLSGLVLLLRSSRLHTRLLPLQRYGRMALTSYVTHGVFGITGVTALASVTTIPYSLLLLLCAPILILQLVFCNWWLSRFAYGPLEWIWRAGTYLIRPPMRLR
ncbi:DUF418 domain-containing protein [Saccharopolyspora sp. K220]|uniref:DUF418 domain-containing protein n=1 Tax=Saccharopolyspora soli TaxID=2926618 RepID=UPI001F59C36F|nr:DUF418 domain-containing protein [Saccharopolyspora soli]MCI2422980.1 DUF418 domain-containing protein [Saccharopolyspora soli]